MLQVIRVVVLLKHGIMEAVECPRDDIFLLARLRTAGICGVFEDREAASAFIKKHSLQPVQPRGESPNVPA